MMKIARVVTTGLVLLSAVAACRDNTGVDASRVVYLGTVSSTKPVIALGDTQRVTVTLVDSARQIIPPGAVRGRVQLSSSDASRATVTPDGLVTAVGTGSVSVTVTVDTVHVSSMQFLVITPPRQLTVLATGDGDADLVWAAMCNGGFGTHNLPQTCASDAAPCRVRAGRAVDPCVWDLGRDVIRYDVGIIVNPGSSTTIEELREDGSVVPPRTYREPPYDFNCGRVAQCYLYMGTSLVGPEVIRLRVMKR